MCAKLKVALLGRGLESGINWTGTEQFVTKTTVLRMTENLVKSASYSN
jgi:hypothetical protein